MKHYIHLCLMAALLVMSGCNDFLTDKPSDRLDIDDAFLTRDDLYRNGVASLYREVGGTGNGVGLQGTGRCVYDLNTFCTDEAIVPTRGTDWYDGGMWQALAMHRLEKADGTGDAWNYLMRQVIACNESLYRIELFRQNNPDENVTDLLAEVRALRAMFLFYAMDLYGRVPLYKTMNPTVEDLKLKSRSQAFMHIITELQAAAPYLSYDKPNRPGVYYGRVTRPVVDFLLAKVMLNAEVYADDDWTDNSRPSGKDIKFIIDGETMNAWQACVYYCSLLEESRYRLEDVQSYCFSVRNEQSVENIYTIPCDKYTYSNINVNLWRSRHYNHAAALGLNGENGPCATLEAMKVFGYGTESPDPRLYSTYYIDEVYDLDNNPVLLDDGTPLVYYPLEVRLDLSNSPYEKTAGARMAKYEVDPTGLKDGQLSDNDIVLMRYADVLLMRAEALCRDGKEGATALVNMVRNRAGAPAKAIVTLDDILDERMLELAWEGWRRNDLIRYGRFTAATADRDVVQSELDGHTLVYPIPGETLTITGDKQNPGY